MTIIQHGSGHPVVLIPGIQGRWEWMRPAVEALARRCRVITFSFADEPTSGATFDEASGIDSYVRQIAHAMDAAGVARATVCGISYGGLIAALFAARHPERVHAVVLVSAIPPSWTPNARARFLMRAPRLLSPVFCVHSLRLLREMTVATGGWLQGLRFGARHVATVAAHPFSPRRMARRARLLDGRALEPEIAAVRAPALIVTGEPELDRVVPVQATQAYLRIWPQASGVTLAHTGHLGLITRPDEFARLVADFAGQAAWPQDQRRRIG